MTALAAPLQGCLLGRANWLERAVLFAAAGFFIVPKPALDLVAVALLLAVAAAQWVRRRRAGIIAAPVAMAAGPLMEERKDASRI